MGFPPLLNLSTRLSTAALPGQTTKTALTEEFMFQNVAYRPTVYRTGEKTRSFNRFYLKASRYSRQKLFDVNEKQILIVPDHLFMFIIQDI